MDMAQLKQTMDKILKEEKGIPESEKMKLDDIQRKKVVDVAVKVIAENQSLAKGTSEDQKKLSELISKALLANNDTKDILYKYAEAQSPKLFKTAKFFGSADTKINEKLQPAILSMLKDEDNKKALSGALNTTAASMPSGETLGELAAFVGPKAVSDITSGRG